MPLDAVIEGILFYKACPVKITDLETLTGQSNEAVTTSLKTLSERLTGGIRLVSTDTDVVLTTAAELTDTIETLRKAELSRDIGKAGAETLAIVLYRGPISRTEIDRIRGVNSGYILRNLSVRGLIERTPFNKRVEYAITPSLLRHLGISSRVELPGFTEIMNQLEAYEKTKDTQD